MAISVDDKLAIIEHEAKYNFLIDALEAEAWADLFTDDGAFYAGGILRGKGRAQLVDYLVRWRNGNGPKLRHWSTNFIVEGDAKTARARSYVMAFNITDGLDAPYIMGVCDDKLIKTDTGWKLTLRQVDIVAGGAAKTP